MLIGNTKNCTRYASQHCREKSYIYFRQENSTHLCFSSCGSTSGRGDRYFMKEGSKSFLMIYRSRRYRWLYGIWTMVVGQERRHLFAQKVLTEYIEKICKKYSWTSTVLKPLLVKMGDLSFGRNSTTSSSRSLRLISFLQ